MNARISGLAGPAPAVVAETDLPPCLIVNPRSFSASRGLAAQATALAAAHDADVVTVDGPDATRAAVESVLKRRQGPLLVLAGDGTVRAIVDQLSCLPPGSWAPDLLVLPGGRTNLTAVDLGTGGDALATLKRALSRAREPRAEIEERRALRIEQAPAAPRHGFFLAAALIDSAIRQCHRQRAERSPQQGDLSGAGYLLRLGVRALFGRSGLACPSLTLDAGRLGTQHGLVRLLVATTLLHRTGLFDPYASRGQGAVRITAVSRAAPRFWRTLPWLLTGRLSNSMNAASGYLSGRCERVQISGLSSYLLDGEAFDVDPSRPVTLTVGPPLRFIRP